MTHERLVELLCKPGEDILLSITPLDCHLNHVVPCILGEAGELWDAIKKHTIYRQDLDMENVIEELGDIEFYLEATRQALFIPRDVTLEANIKKLMTRYKTLKYSDDQARARGDKKGL